MSDFRNPGKIPRRRRREYLRNRTLKLVGNIWIVVEEIAAHIFAFSSSRPHRPLMLLGSVVHHKIHTKVDSHSVTFCCQFRQIFHRSQIFPNLAEIRHSISPVRFSLYSIEKRHQMNERCMTLLDIVQFFLYPFQIPGKMIDIKHHAKHVFLTVPARVLFPLPVTLL